MKVICPFCGKEFNVEDFNRKKIIDVLKNKPLSSSEIANKTGLSKITVRKHLLKLVKEGVIERKIIADDNKLRLRIRYVYKSSSDSP